MADGFLGGHSENYFVWLGNAAGEKVRRLYLQGGSLEWNMFRSVAGSGSITVPMEPEAVWSRDRVIVEYRAEKYEPRTGNTSRLEYQLMVGVVDDEQTDERTGLVTLSFLDKTTLLQEDAVDESYSIPAGQPVMAHVLALIASVGDNYTLIVPSTAKTRVALTWKPGTAKLQIINDLLASIGYTALWADGNGIFNSRPDSSGTTPIHDFIPGPQCLATPEVPDERDLYNIPNKVVCISTTDGEVEPLVGVAANNDPNSEWSIPSRGRVITRTEEEVEATTQAVIDKIAQDFLRTSSLVTWRQTISHLRARIWLRDTVIGHSGQLANVVEIKQNLEPGALMVSVVRRMDTLLEAS